MPNARLSVDGRVTIPKSIRQALKVGAGDRLDLILDHEGGVVVRPTDRGPEQIKGLLHDARRKPVTLAAMNAAVARHRRSAR